MEEEKESAFMGAKEAAKRWGVTQATVSRWCREGEIAGAEQDAPGSPWRIPIDAVPPTRAESSKGMSFCDYWVNPDGTIPISGMTTQHIHSCVDQIRKASNRWRFDTFDSLTDEEKKFPHEILHRCWFVRNRFFGELSAGGESLAEIQSVIQFVNEARV